jgi:SNF family Na+-dependent transporter
MLSILGFAAGYGSLWRFPYLIFKNGGGTFLIPYFILFITMALPMFYLETALG